MSANIVRAELGRHNWGSLRAMGGEADRVPESILTLLSSETEDDAWAAYWELENCVVVQGQLFEASQYVVPVLLAALVGEISQVARKAVLELLFQLVSGESDTEEVERGNSDLGSICRQNAREGIWVIYRELCSGHYDLARDILEMIDRDRDRFAHFVDAYPRGRRNKQRGRIG
ncbi:hypothetical protein [Sphaerimonospora thailandensis]|uniref:Uncharacterized protein n=1 Tax=Sphaerimonospora thailandensis TaxID=795644 RepID=A0A8J3RG02_9ACTN|nr:hypothetical protein [Sphaerimonospora thailandensis]GIH73044.1 hypothetical protein Mth01_52970 [Sphaerimonospora thailandensis]